MSTIAYPLNEVQLELLQLSENLQEQELAELKQLLISFKLKRIKDLADAVWDEKGWTQETMNEFLNTHMRTPYAPPSSSGYADRH